MRYCQGVSVRILMPWFVQCFLVQCCSLKGTLRVGCSNYSTPSIPSSPKALTRGHSV